VIERRHQQGEGEAAEQPPCGGERRGPEAPRGQGGRQQGSRHQKLVERQRQEARIAPPPRDLAACEQHCDNNREQTKPGHAVSLHPFRYGWGSG